MRTIINFTDLMIKANVIRKKLEEDTNSPIDIFILVFSAKLYNL